MPVLALCCTLAALPAQEPADIAGLDVATVQEFDGLDRDRDGSLDELEFAFSEVGRRLREAGLQKTLPQIFAAIDQDGNDIIVLMELVRSQHNRNTHLIDRAGSRTFIKSDADQDGLISLAEYMQQPSAKEENFRRVDLNASGRVGPFEWVQAVRDEFMDRQQALVFSRLDHNDDGAIAIDEFAKGSPPAALAGAFRAIDLNGNREIGPAEFAKAMSMPESQPGVPKETLAAFVEMDRNRDHAVSLREFTRYSPAAKMARGPRHYREIMLEDMFAGIDANRNREISISELAQAPEFGGPGIAPPGHGPGPGPGQGLGPGGGPGGPQRGNGPPGQGGGRGPER